MVAVRQPYDNQAAYDKREGAQFLRVAFHFVNFSSITVSRERPSSVGSIEKGYD